MDDTTLDGQLLDLMLRAGSRWVLWLMLALSLASLAIVGERIWFFVQERAPRARLAAAMTALRSQGPAAALAALAGGRSMEVAVARACLTYAADGPAAVEEHKAAALETERMRYEQRIAFLGTLGNNAPFIGLFGTVLGIIRSFHDLSGNSLQGTQAVMSGIAESLVATGIGLLVALPAVATYNTFIRRVETSVAGAEAVAHQILAYLKTPRPAAEAEA
jgi:biopolymer transport protein ExbB